MHNAAAGPLLSLAVLLLACVAQVQARRVVEAPEGQVEEDAKLLKRTVEAEAELVEQGIEKLGAELKDAGGDFKPIKASFEIAGNESLANLEDKSKIKQTISVWHEAPAPDANDTMPYLEAKIQAKSDQAASDFVSILNPALKDFGLDRYVTVTSNGQYLTFTSMPVPLDPGMVGGLETFAHHVHHVELTQESVYYDFAGIFLGARHSNALLLEQMYKGLKTSIDAGLTPELEGMLEYIVPPPQRSDFKLWVNLFAGFSADVRLGYNSTALREALLSHPPLNMTADSLVEIYREMGEHIPMSIRGHPMCVRGLEVLEAANQHLWQLESVEFKGLPAGLRLLMKLENVNPFSIYYSLVKESGLDKILLNQTSETG